MYNNRFLFDIKSIINVWLFIMDIVSISVVFMVVISSLATISCITIIATYTIKQICKKRRIVYPIFIDNTLHGNMEFIGSISSLE